jgi:hypothetical protein
MKDKKRKIKPKIVYTTIMVNSKKILIPIEQYNKINHKNLSKINYSFDYMDNLQYGGV